MVVRTLSLLSLLLRCWLLRLLRSLPHSHSSHTPRKTTSALSTLKPGVAPGGRLNPGKSASTSRTLPQDRHTTWWWLDSTLGSKRAEPVPRSSAEISPSSARSCRVWYTVLRETLGISVRTRSYTRSAEGWVSSPSRARNMHWRWAVIFHPFARKRSVSASG